MDLDNYKRSFFDRLAVVDAVDKGLQKALSRFGAFVRTRARSSLKRSKKTAPAGTPPRVHTSNRFASLKNILFAYDPVKKSVIVGPVLIGSGKRSVRTGGITVPELQEYGGTSPIAEVQLSGGLWMARSGRRWQQGRPMRTRTAHYASRPYMRPALVAESNQIGGQLRNLIK